MIFGRLSLTLATRENSCERCATLYAMMKDAVARLRDKLVTTQVFAM